MERNWTSVGAEHNGTDSQRVRLAAMFDRLEWKPIVAGEQVAMMPALGIRAAIDELRIPKASHYAISNEMAPYGLYGIWGHYKNGCAEVYVCDEGTRLVVLASDFHPNNDGGAT
jgi:hypothetical protein